MQRNHKSGNNILHHIIQLARDCDQILPVISTLDQEELEKLSGQYNNHGQLPIHLLPQFPRESYSTIRELLLNAMPKVAKPLHEKIDFAEVCKEYNPPENSALYNNLKLGCEVANEARRYIKASNTHPDSNGPLSQNLSLEREISQNRSAVDIKIYSYILSNPDIHFEELVFPNISSFILLAKPRPEIMKKMNHMRAKIFMQFEKGNCAEFGDIVEYLLYKRKINSTLYEIKNGDHIANKIGESDDDDDNVIIDAWAGDVYPSNLVTEKLRDYESLQHNDKAYNCTPLINSNFHRLSSNKLCEQLAIKINWDSQNIVGKFILSLAEKTTLKEFYILIKHVKPELEDLCKKNRITINELLALQYPVKTLLYLFLNFSLLIDFQNNTSISLKEIDEFVSYYATDEDRLDHHDEVISKRKRSDEEEGPNKKRKLTEENQRIEKDSLTDKKYAHHSALLFHRNDASSQVTGIQSQERTFEFIPIHPEAHALAAKKK